MEKWTDTAYFTLVALVGGCISYLTSTSSFSFKEFCIKGLSSGFTGYLIYQLCDYGSLPHSITAFLCGTFGYIGSEVTINLLKKYAIKKVNSIK